VLVPAAILEVFLRDGVVLWFLALVLSVAPLVSLLWRRSDPLAAVVVAYVAHAAIHFAPIFDHHHTSESLYATAVVLLFPYSLLRWGSGREAAIGIGVILGTHAFTAVDESATAIEAAAGLAVLLFPAALGASVRYRSVVRVREVDQVKLRERGQLARELHDTVAHHVSAIAIQAQAGRTVAATNPQAAVEALKVIEAEASRTLAEMRTMVGALRQSDEAATSFTPQPGVADIGRLAERAGAAPRVEVAPSGDLDDLTPSVDAAVYRLAQESITNALRHARRATRILVAVTGERDSIRLTVTDDGDSSSSGMNGTLGFGIVGMTERAELLGGTLKAGPNHERGWTVTAVLPRTSPSARGRRPPC
jgi:signal transduction histidine kinase